MRWAWFPGICVFVLSTSASGPKIPNVPKWTRFEQSFTSSVAYERPLQSCTFAAEFIAPSGETNLVYGFWDGGKTWRLRFLPDQPGRWTFRTHCSDEQNEGLQNQTGVFLCTAPLAIGRFARHGPIRMARDRRHFEHQDGTPFFWISDVVWDGTRLSTPSDWSVYAQIRAAQKFTAAQWSVVPGKDSEGESAFDDRTRIIPNLEFFQRLDAKIETLNRAGLLSIVAPLWNRERQYFDPLPEDQKILLLRYLLARWGANNVAWLLHCESGTPEEIAHWKKIGESVFAARHSGPVILTLAERRPALFELRDQDWIDGFGYQSGRNPAALRELASNPAARPLIQITFTEENKKPSGTARRTTADDVRREVWSNLLNISSAGTGYGSEAVANWNFSVDQNIPHDLPLWQKSLFLPGAKQMAVVSEMFNSIPFWQLRPASPRAATPRTEADDIIAAETDNQDLSLFYAPPQPALELPLKALPRSPILNWFDPRTGKTNSAVAVVGPGSIKFPTPEPGDWILVVKSGRASKP